MILRTRWWNPREAEEKNQFNYMRMLPNLPSQNVQNLANQISQFFFLLQCVNNFYLFSARFVGKTFFIECFLQRNEGKLKNEMMPGVLWWISDGVFGWGRGNRRILIKIVPTRNFETLRITKEGGKNYSIGFLWQNEPESSIF